MSKSGELTLSDVRGVFRVLGNARELRHDIVEQEQVIVDGLCELVGSPLGFASAFEGFRPGETTLLERVVPGTTQDSHLMRIMARWATIGSYDDDVMVNFGRRFPQPAIAMARSHQLSWDELERVPKMFSEFYDHISLFDTLTLWFRYPGSSRIRGYAIQRFRGERTFSARDVALANLFANELFALYGEGKLEPLGALAQLPPYLAAFLPFLLSGMSQRQIATKSGLTYQTVRSYTKAIYEHLGVHNRHELTELVKGPGRSPKL